MDEPTPEKTSKRNGINQTYYFPKGIAEKLERLQQEICRAEGKVFSKSHIVAKLIEDGLDRAITKYGTGKAA